MRSINDKEKAISYIRTLVDKRCRGKISPASFLTEIVSLNPKYRNILGNRYKSEIENYAIDLDGSDGTDCYRKYQNMTAKDEEKLLLDNIEKLFPREKYAHLPSVYEL